jgi:predicted TIM-barrel fold metal-dependent hydrolase
MAAWSLAAIEEAAMSENARSAAPDGPPPNPNPRQATYRPPPGSCDSHCHIYGPFSRFPLPPDRSFTPNEAPETALRRLHDHFGFDLAVIVQSQGHGFDHQPVMEALATGGGRYRAVALIRPDTPPEEVARLNAAGFCGARFSFMSHLGYPDLSAVRSAMALVRPYEWHVAIHVSGRGIVDMEDFIRQIDARVVIDHMARPDVQEGPNGPAMNALRHLLDTGRVWVKLSGADRLSHQRAPYIEAVPIARSLAEHAPERVLWGSDWPHVNLHGPMSDDACLVDLIPQIAASERAQRLMLVDNPVEFFRFQGT